MKLHLPLLLLVVVCGVPAAVGNTGRTWDPNWGAAGLAGAPDAAAPQYQANITAGGVTALVQPAGVAAPYDFGSYTAATLVGAGNATAQVFGGAASTDSTATGAVAVDSWIAAEAGQYGMLVGGNYADNWNGGAAFNFTGNSHLLVNGATVGTVIGGNFKDGQSAAFTGSSYISVLSGNVTGSIVGAGVVTHNRNVQFTGDTNVFVYVPLSDNSATAINQLPVNMVMGGYGWATNTWKTQTITGDTHVTVDLSAYTGPSAAFSKHIVGGGFSGAGRNAQVINGDTHVTVNAGELALADNVRVVGAHWVNAGSGTLTGTAHLTLSGGTFNDWVVGGAWTDTAGTTTSCGGVQMQLAGGVFNGNVVGATCLAAGAATAEVGAVQIDIAGADLAGTLYGGYYINGTGAEALSAQLGDVNITLSGGSVNNIIGGSYVPRNNAAAVVQQGNIAIDLQGGMVGGDVYAAGQQAGSTPMQTASATVTVGAAVAFADSAVVSGGYAGVGGTSTVTGSRLLVFGDAQVYTNVAGVLFDSFDEVQVANGAVVVVKGFSQMPQLRKTGGGSLAFTAGAELNSIHLEGGTLTLATAVDGTAVSGNIWAADNAVLHIDGVAPLSVYGEFSAPNVYVDSGALALHSDNNVLRRIQGGGELTLCEASQTSFRFNTDNGEQIIDLARMVIESGAVLTLYSEGETPLGTGVYVLGTLGELSAPLDYAPILQGVPFSQVDPTRSFLAQDAGYLSLFMVARGSNPLAEVAASHNAKAGAELLWNSAAVPGGDAEAAYREAIQLLLHGDTAGANSLMAAVAGSSYSATGSAFMSNLQQRVYSIRNRTTNMGLSPCYVYDDIPLWNAWVNADGEYSSLQADGTAAGYTLSSWGGTLGVDFAFDDAWCGGFAFTALYGDFDAKAPDALSGDFDTYTLALFAKYDKRAWSHTFIAAGSWLATSLSRRVQMPSHAYSTTANPHGVGLGLMYEIACKIPLGEQQTSFVQPFAHVVYTHNAVRGFSEHGADAALTVGDQALNSLVFGLGLRAQTPIGESEDERLGTLQAHALLKIHALDRRSEADVAFTAGGAAASVESARASLLGAEIGAGLSIPVGVGSGVLYLDAAAEFRADAVDVYGTVGYRFRF